MVNQSTIGKIIGNTIGKTLVKSLVNIINYDEW